MNIQFTVQIFKEGRLYVAYTPEFDVSSCGGTQAKAKANLFEAVRLFLEEADKIGTLQQILEEGE
jgi:predicted RNase H-like HicB family nuclease